MGGQNTFQLQQLEDNIDYLQQRLEDIEVLLVIDRKGIATDGRYSCYTNRYVKHTTRYEEVSNELKLKRLHREQLLTTNKQ